MPRSLKRPAPASSPSAPPSRRAPRSRPFRQPAPPTPPTCPSSPEEDYPCLSQDTLGQFSLCSADLLHTPPRPRRAKLLSPLFSDSQASTLTCSEPSLPPPDDFEVAEALVLSGKHPSVPVPEELALPDLRPSPPAAGRSLSPRRNAARVNYNEANSSWWDRVWSPGKLTELLRYRK
ncbi:hypothetical protein TeGR_g13180 [Tetraparma gracilis]|uniref:Uncharacterized protein n=1 Tax=Tetraparma gracilis TaxID=2962635 RepID=A0ABQ6MXH2_9STRA|nr:hypothetical protein TeGR_g13180 [Tetraparma gracilis]